MIDETIASRIPTQQSISLDRYRIPPIITSVTDIIPCYDGIRIRAEIESLERQGDNRKARLLYHRERILLVLYFHETIPQKDLLRLVRVAEYQAKHAIGKVWSFSSIHDLQQCAIKLCKLYDNKFDRSKIRNDSL